MSRSRICRRGLVRIAPLRAVVMDARRGEVYGGVYDNRLQPVQEEVVASLQVGWHHCRMARSKSSPKDFRSAG